MKLELNKKAFTLIELLVVIAIVGILSGLIVVSMNGSIASANDAKRKANISTISKALMIYGTLNGGVYPIGTNCDIGVSPAGPNYCANLNNLSELLPNFPIDPNGTRYKYFSNSTGSTFTVSAVLSNGQFAVGPVQQCPTDWIDSGHGFCVMKYEAKNNGSNVAVSQVSGTPWVSIPQYSASVLDAIEVCSNLGNGSHLITNAEWTILARDIESVSSNWTSSVLNRGNSNSSAAMDGTSALTGINKRTHTLSNGEVIWDLAGNVWEWTNDACTAGTGTGNWQGAGWIEWNNSSLSDYEDLTAGPTGNFTSANGVGQYYGCSANDNRFLRGGSWGDTSNAGVFDLYLGSSSGYSNTSIGFRCAR